MTRPGTYAWLWAVLGAVLLGSCSNKDCTDLQNTLPYAAFLTSATPHQAVTLDSLQIQAVGNTTPLPLTAAVKETYLPFRLDAHATTFVLRYHTGEPDTLTFDYDPEPFFTSHECGVVYYYHINKVLTTTHRIDSVTVPGGVITNQPGNNIFIYLRAL